ncbi:MAG: hypothetical protein IPM96_16915 [Ignavibacteria bacterium]|nr:hypothetical protein [Ignavibacteria bacterium]
MKLNKNGKRKIQYSEITQNSVTTSLLRYFDISYEMPLALNPGFIVLDSKAYKNLEIFKKTNDWKDELLNTIKITGVNNPGINCFRLSNMIRHHYVSHPLLNYTIEGRGFILNLSSSSLSEATKILSKRLEFSTVFISLSPRVVKFWECCIAIVYNEMLIHSASLVFNYDERYQNTTLFTNSKKMKISYWTKHMNFMKE